MTIAVFVFPEQGLQGKEEEAWLSGLISDLCTAERTSKVVFFTYAGSWAPPVSTKLEVEIVPRPRFLWSRFSLQARLRTALATQGVSRVLCLGLSSVVAGIPAQVLLLRDEDFRKKRVVRLRKKVFAPIPVLVTNEKAREHIVRLAGDPLSVRIVYGSLPQLNLIEPDTQLVKDRFTAGAEYFLCQTDLSQTPGLVHLLKAFSRFKKRQKSGWKLVLLPDQPGPVTELESLLATYKYREDVVLVAGAGPEVRASLFAAAWCFIGIGTPSYLAQPLLHALAWQLPVVGTFGFQERAGAAGLYFEAGDEQRLAEHLMHIYKDESVHRTLRAAALQEKARFGWQPLLQVMGIEG